MDRAAGFDLTASEAMWKSFAHLTSNYHLGSASSAVDAGVSPDLYPLFETLYGLSIETDRDGEARPQGAAWDIGAYEYPGE